MKLTVADSSTIPLKRRKNNAFLAYAFGLLEYDAGCGVGGDLSAVMFRSTLLGDANSPPRNWQAAEVCRQSCALEHTDKLGIPE